jgi:imidazolonepropionase-like amidohydrolase
MKKRILCFFITIMCLVNSSYGQDLLIKNATVLTITKGTLTNTDILIKNGKIANIQKNISAAVKAIDASGKYIMPGIIDAHSHIAIDATNEASHPITAEVYMGDVINPYDITIYQALAGGVTAVHLLHGSANVIGGQCQTIKLRYGVLNPKDMIMQGAPRTIKFALGENPKSIHGDGQNLAPRTRMGIEQVIRTAFEDAKKYKAEVNNFEKGLVREAPIRDYRLETIADILDEKILIHCHAYRADEILMMMKILKDYGINKICFQHVNEGFKVAPELAAFGAGASVFSDWWATKFELYYSTAYNAAILIKNGVVTSINSDDPGLLRHLYHEAAKTQRYGDLTDDEALSLITLNPAKQLGIDHRVGSIEVGKEADLAIFENHPLSIYAIPIYTIVDGKILFNKADDKADQRLNVDPMEKYGESYMERENHGADRCMQDTYHALFNHAQH